MKEILKNTHPSWHKILENSLNSLDASYLNFLQTNKDYFPNIDNFLNAFSMPLEETKYILFGQDPYPREKSAIGYAFIDGRVKDIFSDTGFSKEVNRATSLRNFMKMLLVSEGYLKDELSQEAISKLDKSEFINSIDTLKNNFISSGVLLLNMALVFTKKEDSKYHIKMFKPFVKTLLSQLGSQELILFGSMAKEVEKFDIQNFKIHKFCHPYNIEFITDKMVHLTFKKMKLIYRPRSEAR